MNFLREEPNLAEEEVDGSRNKNKIPSDGGEVDGGAAETTFRLVFLAKPVFQSVSTTYSCLKYNFLPS